MLRKEPKNKKPELLERGSGLLFCVLMNLSIQYSEPQKWFKPFVINLANMYEYVSHCFYFFLVIIYLLKNVVFFYFSNLYYKITIKFKNKKIIFNIF